MNGMFRPDPKPVKKKKRLKMHRYAKERKAYLEAKPQCEVDFCPNRSTEIHHKKGRSGSLLYDPVYFLAVCRECHRKIELNPEWAKMYGYSVSRLT